jgi:amino acid adenylation domain-containing protein
MSVGSGRFTELATEDKRALVARLLEQKLRNARRTAPISHNQAAMWFVHQLAAQSAAYNVAFSARVCSEVDVPALQRAFQAIVSRHASLRTTFKTEDGIPVQEIHGRLDPQFTRVDVSGASDDALLERVREAYRLPFDLERGPVLRVSLFSRSVTDHVLLIVAHHISLDAWSLWILLDELRASYGAEQRGRPVPMPPAPFQYADYAAWQLELLAGPEGERLWSYWRERLAGPLPTLELTTDRPRSTGPTFTGATRVFDLGAELPAQLRALAHAERTTLYTTLLAAFQVLLHHQSRQDDILVGSPVFGRSRAEHAGILGNCINMLVLRGDLSGSPTFRAHLARTRETVLSALEHQDYPFPLLVSKLMPGLAADRSPLFRVTFDLQRLDRPGELARLFLPSDQCEPVEVGGLRLAPYPLAQQEGQFDLSLQLAEIGDRVVGNLKYNRDLFDAATIDSMVESLRMLLRNVTADPDQRVSALLTTGTDPSAATAVDPLRTLMADLRRRDIRVWLDGDRLRVNAPAGVLDPRLQDELRRRKEDLIALLRQSGRQPSGVIPAITPVSRDGKLPLSFAQQRLWFLDQFEPGNPAYNIAVTLHVRGAIDASALRRSLDELLRRHETLRTRLAVVDGQPIQVIEPWRPAMMAELDLTHLPPADRAATANEMSQREGSLPFDLKRAPLFRTQLAHLSDDEHVLTLVVHHIAADGWSLGIIDRELSTIYDAVLHDAPLPLPEPSVDYADFAAWQQQWMTGARLQGQLDYWKRQLGGSLPALDLPADFPRPAVRSWRGAKSSFTLDLELRDALKSLARREGATLFMVLLAAYKTLLFRTTHQEDVVVGTPVAGRGQVETEGLVGLFLNNLVLRTDLSGDPTFLELLGRVRHVALEAYAHQDVPFEMLVAALQPERDASRLPLFQTLFALQNMPFESLQLGSATAEPVVLPGTTSRYDLTFEVWERPDDLLVVVEYNTDLFRADTIRRLEGHFATLLRAIVAEPTTPISALPLLTPPECHQLLSAWNSTDAAYPRDRAVHRLFEARAIDVPDAIAVAFEGQQITYRQLNERANTLARHLKTLHVGPGSIVGVYLERSIDMVVALFGILKSGGTYLPLDPLFPAERLAYMLADSRASVLLTEERLVATLEGCEATVVCVDAEWPRIAQHDVGNLPDACDPDGLAYVLYTSGSTGRPKGVEIPHRALVNFLCSMREVPGLGADDVLLAVTTLSFDIAGLELYLPLIVGARLELLTGAVAADGSRLLAAIERSGATVMQATPATWRLLLAAGWQGTPGLKVLCGGEALSGELASQLLGRCASLWNMYGPTETTIWSTVHKVEVPETVVPIGRPIANTRVYVLDARRQPVPIGTAGELYIGGDGLARGYLNRPELTAERFVPHPFADEARAPTGGPPARLYRTGDLVRYRADGSLEYLQRLDHQVKIRGYRIELGEIESLLEQQPSVRQAVVVAREDSTGDRQLVAYVSPAPGASLAPGELRDALKQRLPSYMLPAVLVEVETFPLTPNGKVDRKALPAPEAGRLRRMTQSAPPRTQTERTIAAIWQRVLNVDAVGVDDNFFDLGGHSLLIIQVLHQLREAFDTDLTVARMFQYPTVGALAGHIDRPTQRAAGVGLAQDRGQRLRAVLGHRSRSTKEGPHE